MTRFIAPALTLIGVPVGLVATGGNTQTVMTLSLAVWLAVLAFFVRRWPLTVAIISLLSVAAFRTADLIGSGWVWPATAAFVALALAGRLRAAIVTALVALTFGFAWDAFTALDHGPEWALVHVGGEKLWLVAVLAAGVAYRNNLRWRDELAHRLAEDGRRRRAEERVEIARDLHDVVSHTLAVVGVHLNVALDAFDADPAEARESLKLAQDVRGRAMTDLKSLVDVLHDGPVAGLDGLDRLVEQVRSPGLSVSLNEFGERADVAAPVATAVFRVVQESLTNTVRHASASHVTVTIRYAAAGVVVDVRDDGHGADAMVDGNGITGMRGRVAALGGALTAGPADGGFQVRATIPQ
ncbi:sensor histidine kinase [Actinoplanes sp. TBRC 11911]|uniref:sensor histidine kinase n=1 Tax=Actinoplanes sp. TBRC 11911 TaxID=2729386 RepID=UPI00145E21A7|nr:histidine kinase [Actinoplanes sp. TBRC 11911]NMO53216.1 sensor histidine kinase [Actinoplanes sp. TBRC 11911]